MLNELLRRVLFLPPQASSVAREIDSLHYFVIGTTMAGATVITIAAFVLVVRYGARRGPWREDPAARPPRWAEATVVGGLLSLFCLWWVLGFRQYVRLEVAPRDALPIYVTAKQWMWKFAYPDGERSIATLYVPAGRAVQLLMTSRDVIHSFYVPDFRIKQDVLPGRYTTAWFSVNQPGTHLVMCAEYCGTSHSTMRAQVVALAPDDYARWLAAARRDAEVPLPQLVDGASGETTPIPGGLPGPRGESPLSVEDFPVAEPVSLARLGTRAAGELGCLRCHTLDGAPHIGPTWAGLFGSIVPLQGGGTVVADEAYLTESMMEPAEKLHAGFPAVMPVYQGLLTPTQAGAIVELIKTLREAPRRVPDLVPPQQEALPSPGAVAVPPPRLPIRVGGAGARPLAGPGADGGAP